MGVFFGVLYKFFAFLGFLLLLAMVGGGTWDYIKANKNIDWAKLDKNNIGYVKRGYVLNIHFDCGSSFRAIEIFRKKLLSKDMGSTAPEGFKAACSQLSVATTAAATKPAESTPPATEAPKTEDSVAKEEASSGN